MYQFTKGSTFQGSALGELAQELITWETLQAERMRLYMSNINQKSSRLDQENHNQSLIYQNNLNQSFQFKLQ